MGFMSVGSLWIGAMAEVAGAPLAVALGAVAYGVFALALFGLNPRLRRSEEWDSTVSGASVANPATPE